MTTGTTSLAGPQVSEEAPAFELPDQNMQPWRLSDWRGRRNVVIVFYPWAFTRVCTGELCAIRDELPSLQNADTALVSISVDSVMVHRVFADQERFEYPMLSDFWPHGAVARSYGVFDETTGAAVRGTFIIDRSGIVRWKVVNAVPDARDIAEYQRVLATL